MSNAKPGNGRRRWPRISLRSTRATFWFAGQAPAPYLRWATSPRSQMKHEQLALFAPQSMPAGFRYAPDLIGPAEEARLVAAFGDLPFKEFAFHGFLGKRRVVPFGSRHDYNGGGLQAAAPIPPFLLPLRERAAAFAVLAAGSPGARADHRIQTGRRHRLAPRPAALRRRDRDFVVVAVYVPPAPQARHGMGTRLAAARSPLDLSDAWPVALGVGAQHPGGEGASLFDHVPVDVRSQP